MLDDVQLTTQSHLLIPRLQVSIATLGVGSGALVAGLFGMNVGDKLHSSISSLTHLVIQLLSHFEVHPYGFYAMTGFATTLAVTVAWAGLRKYVCLTCAF